MNSLTHPHAFDVYQETFHPYDDRGLRAAARRLSSDRLKRTIDVVVALSALIVLAPLLLLVSLVISLETPGSPFFAQRRTGLNGRVFHVYKFRSMRVREDGDTIRQAHKQDHRITPFGAFIRRTSIDELPQLLNILKGEMSLAGPRPHALAHDSFYGAIVPQYNQRFLVKPGLTGLAQVSGHRGATETINAMSARIQVDLDYIRGWSHELDAKILTRTLLIVLVRADAV